MKTNRRKIYKQGSVTTQQLKDLLKSTKYCRFCGCRMTEFGVMKTNKTIEHILPISKGGQHEIENIEILCWRCNTLKKALMEEEFLDKYMQPYWRIWKEKVYELFLEMG